MIQSSLKEDWRSFKQLPTVERGYVLILLITLAPTAINFLRPICTRFGIPTDFINEIIWTIVLLMGAPYVLKKAKVGDWVIYLAIVSFYLISPLFYPTSSEFVSENMVGFLLQTLPFYFVGRALDFNLFNRYFIWIARIGVFVGVLFALAFSAGFTSSIEITADNMVAAYNLLWPSLYLTWYAIEKDSMMDKVMSVVSIFVLLSFGTRGPAVALVVFFVAYLLFFRQYKRNYLVKSLILAAGVIIFQYLEVILTAIMFLSESLGLSTRVFESILYRDSTDDVTAGREDLYTDIVSLIKNNPDGYGFGGDRIFTGAYSHNIELEMLISFGTVLGSIFLLGMLLLFVRALRKSWGTELCSFLLILMCFPLIQLQFSGTFCNSTALFLLIGISVTALNFKEKNE